MHHYVKECGKFKRWFEELGKNSEERIVKIWDNEMDERKGKILKRLRKEKEKKEITGKYNARGM